MGSARRNSGDATGSRSLIVSCFEPLLQIALCVVLIMSASPAAAVSVSPAPAVQFNLTGFGEFAGVKNNPTEQLINSFDAYLKLNPLPAPLAIQSMTVLETSGVGSREALMKLRAEADAQAPKQLADVAADSSALAPASSSPVCHRVWLHFGVHAGSSCFALESTAYNCANFRIADQRGWAPCNEPIHESCAAKDLRTDLDLTGVSSALAAAGWKVCVSTDPGRFVCNWIFFNSLHAVQGQCSEHSVFIHVPSHDVYSLEQQQKFARDAIVQIGKTLENGYQRAAPVATPTVADAAVVVTTHAH